MADKEGNTLYPTQPVAPRQPVGAQRVGKQLTNADTGETTTPGRFGQFQTNDMAFLLRAAAADPENAAAILRLALGQTGRPLGRFAGAWDKMHGEAFQTALALAGADGAGGQGFGTLEDIAGGYLDNALLGNDLLGYAGGLGRRVAGMDFTGMDSALMDQFLNAGLALQGLNMGGLGQRQRKGQLDDVIWADIVRNFENPGSEKNFADLLKGSPYQRAMSAYGAP